MLRRCTVMPQSAHLDCIWPLLRIVIVDIGAVRLVAANVEEVNGRTLRAMLDIDRVPAIAAIFFAATVIVSLLCHKDILSLK